MPKIKTATSKKADKPVAPVKPVQPVTQAPHQVNDTGKWPVQYPKVQIFECSTTSPSVTVNFVDGGKIKDYTVHGPLTVADCKRLLGWETEVEFKERKVKESPTTKLEIWSFGEDYHCKNAAAIKVRCNCNAHNRPFDQGWCEDLTHTIMNGQWAGPATINGETINGETVRISRYGRVLSGQHQMTALILAGEWLEKARTVLGISEYNKKYPMWAVTDEATPPSPFLETILVLGMSEDPRVLMTVDYVKPRTAADVFYTSDVFKKCASVERKELCKILATAVDVLWTRTDTRGYKTHPELVAFLDRHKKLLDHVTFIYEENKPLAGGGRKLSKLRLQPGLCAALMFLMGSSGPETDGDIYRNPSDGSAPSEKNLDWSLSGEAQDFWSLLSQGKDFMPVRAALGNLIDSSTNNEDNQGLGGRAGEKLAILSKAWEIWGDPETSKASPFSMEDIKSEGRLTLSYIDVDDKGNELPDGQIKLIDGNNFGGIDCPTPASGKTARKAEPEAPDDEEHQPSGEEIAKATAAARERREAKEAKKKEDAKEKAKSKKNGALNKPSE